MQADWILRGGPVVTVDSRNTVAEAVAVKDGRVLAVGRALDVEPLVGPGTRVTNLGGRCLIPGFVENHAHLTNAAEAQTQLDTHYESGATSIPELVRRVAERAKTIPPGQWITGRGYDHTRLAEGRHPTRWELNAATTEHPVAICNRSGHAWACNDLALQAFGAHDGMTEPPGAWLPRDEQGRLLGPLGENCRPLMIYPVLHNYTAEGLAPVLQQSQAWWHSMGFTAASDAGTRYAAEVGGWMWLERQGAITLRINFMVRGELIPKLIDFGVLTGYGSDWVRIGFIKAAVDGAQLMRTCAMFEEWPDQPGYYGTLAMTPAEMDEFAMTGQRLGLNMTGHAIGDHAIELMLQAYARAAAAYPRPGLRHRIEHCCFPTDDQIARIKQMGIVVNTQCGFLEYAGKSLQSVLGPERMRNYLPYRTFLDNGIVASGGSDFQCMHPDPLLHMHAMTTRRVDRGQGPAVAPHQAISVMEALQVMTWNGAYSRCDEDKFGSIEVGKYADFAVLDRDISQVQPADLLAMLVKATIVNGQVVYGEV